MASKATFLRDAVEPAFIVLAFTFGTLINRRRPVSKDDVERRTSQMQEASPLQPAIGNNPASRFFHMFPFLVEIWYWNLTYWVYQGLRALSARLIQGNEAIFTLAKSHAIAVLRLEQRLGIFVERYVQQYILSQMPWLMPILAKVYYSHISLGVCFIIYCYTCLPPPTFRSIRRTIAVDNGIAFVIISLWRCMPPRLLPPEYGFVDVLHGAKGGGTSWTNNRFQLTIAAMPSLHFGTALFLAWCICRFSPHRWLRCLAPLWPAAMLLTIVATANHFILDAMVGAMVPFIGWRLNRIILTFKPLEDWLFATFKMETLDPSSHKPILRNT